MKFKPLSILPLLFLCSCSMNNEFQKFSQALRNT